MILAAVSINAAFNTKIIDTAVNGAVNYAEAGRQEQVTFDELDGSLQDILKRIEEYDIGGTVPTEEPITTPTAEPTPTIEVPATPTPKPTPTPRPNSNGTITDIVRADFTLPSKSNIIITNIGKIVDYKFIEKEVTISGELSGTGTDQIYKVTNGGTYWRVLAEDSNYMYLIGKNTTKIELKGVLGFSNGVGVLDATCDSAFQPTTVKSAVVRNMKLTDLDSLGTISGPFSYTRADGYYPEILISMSGLSGWEEVQHKWYDSNTSYKKR